MSRVIVNSPLLLARLLLARPLLRFALTPLPGAVAWRGQIAADAGFEQLAADQRSPGNELRFAGLPDGDYVLRVRGNSMIDEQIRDGDWVVVEDRKTANNGEMVVALLKDADVTQKTFYRDNGRIRLQPANVAMAPIYADPAAVQIQGVVVGVMRRY